MNSSAPRGPRTSAPSTTSSSVPNPRRRRRAGGGGTPGGAGVPPQRAEATRPEVVSDAVTEVVTDDRSFVELGVDATLVDVLLARGVTAPFPIQAATLPDSLAGRDVLGRGRTGSGKTIAFALPLVQRLAASGRPRRATRPRSLVLVPTRELANQVAASITPLAQALGMRTAVVFGGVGQNPQVVALREGVDVLIACPGRLEDLIRQGHCQLDAVEVTVLDEADHMADLGFLPGVKRLLDATPVVGQRLLFSATLDNGIDVLVKRYLSEPVVHSVDPAVAPVSTMEHHVLEVSADGKAGLVRELAAGQGRTVLFTRTKHAAKKLAKQLTAAGIPAVDLHGNLSQNARERNLGAFSEGSVRVLCATDIAARGIHVDEVGLVVHVDPPTEHKAYLHRSGRTARAGAGGLVVTVATPDQRSDVRTLARQAGISPQWTPVGTGHALVTRLVGPAADWVDPADSPVPTAPAQPQARTRAAGGPAAKTASRSAAKPATGPGARQSAGAGSRNAPRTGSAPAREGAASDGARRRRRGGRGRGSGASAPTN